MATLTVANSTLILTVLDLFPAPQQLQGYATDDVFSVEAVSPVEVRMGVDGRQSAGYTPVSRAVTIHLQADSASNGLFETWAAQQDALLDAFEAELVVQVPAIGRLYTCLTGFLTRYPPFSDGRKLLEPRAYTITFESILPAPL